VKLYFDGKIRQWYSRGDGKGVVFLVDAKTEDEARAIMETWANSEHFYKRLRFGKCLVADINANRELPQRLLRL
jgi:hypothetical protein